MCTFIDKLGKYCCNCTVYTNTVSNNNRNKDDSDNKTQRENGESGIFTNEPHVTF